MKILAPFDQTEFSQVTIPLLGRLAALPAAEITLLTVAHEPSGTMRRRGVRRPVTAAQVFDRPLPIVLPDLEPQQAETGEQAVERVLAQLEAYLLGLAGRLSASVQIHVEAHISDSPAKTIVERAREEAFEVIVMATHSRAGLSRVLFGSTTEEVVRSGVAPVLVVHPRD